MRSAGRAPGLAAGVLVDAGEIGRPRAGGWLQASVDEHLITEEEGSAAVAKLEGCRPDRRRRRGWLQASMDEHLITEEEARAVERGDGRKNGRERSSRVLALVNVDELGRGPGQVFALVAAAMAELEILAPRLGLAGRAQPCGDRRGERWPPR